MGRSGEGNHRNPTLRKILSASQPVSELSSEPGVSEERILSFELDLARDIRYRNPLELAAHVRKIVEHSSEQFYLFVDEIQMSDQVPNPYNAQGMKITFYDALNDLKSLPNIDIYVTGSNLKMLSSDILTEFRGRSDEIRVHPLSFAEYYSATGGGQGRGFLKITLLRRTSAYPFPPDGLCQSELSLVTLFRSLFERYC